MAVNPHLSKNFRYDELKCKCGCEVCKIERRLLDALQEFRELVGKPFSPNSAYRCPSYNTAIGGVSNSQHIYGRAVDVSVKGMTPVELYKLALQIPAFANGGIGIYLDRNFIHMDVGPGPRRWAEKDGKRVRYFDKSP